MSFNDAMQAGSNLGRATQAGYQVFRPGGITMVFNAAGLQQSGGSPSFADFAARDWQFSS